MIFLGSGY